MNTYTGRDRMVAAVKGQHADRVPATVMFGPYAAKLAGFNIPEFLTDAEKHAKAHVQAYKIFHPDIELGGVGGVCTSTTNTP